MKAYPKIKSFRSYIRSQPKSLYKINFSAFPFKRINLSYWYIDKDGFKVFR